jgi:hypothetical protein
VLEVGWERGSENVRPYESLHDCEVPEFGHKKKVEMI